MKLIIREMLRERLLGAKIAPENEIFSAYNGRYLFDVSKAYKLIETSGVSVEIKKFGPILLKQFSHPEFSAVDNSKINSLKNKIDYNRPLGILVNFRNPDTKQTEWILIDGNHRVRIAGDAGENALLYVIKNPDDVNSFMRFNKKMKHELFPVDENRNIQKLLNSVIK